MCTSMALRTKDFYFGRNLDLEYDFGERVVIAPRNYQFSFRECENMESHYAMIGMATVEEEFPLYAEAVNEMGLAMAGLNFPGNAYYPPEQAQGKENISPFELIPWLLGRCASVAEVRNAIGNLHLTGIPFSESLPLTPLHWHIADRKESIVLEPIREGLKLYDNPVGILTNNPPFDFQITNLNQYLNLTTEYPDNRFHPEIGLEPFGVGMGGIGLPGDFSPVSRFVKAAFLLFNSVGGDSEEQSVSRFFHLLDAVAMPDGIVTTPEGKYEKTSYSCCVNAGRGIFYYKTYENNQLTAIDMRRENLEGNQLIEYALIRQQQVCRAN